MLDVCGLLIALATFDALWCAMVVVVSLMGSSRLVLVVSRIGFSIRVVNRTSLVLCV